MTTSIAMPRKIVKVTSWKDQLCFEQAVVITSEDLHGVLQEDIAMIVNHLNVSYSMAISEIFHGNIFFKKNHVNSVLLVKVYC